MKRILLVTLACIIALLAVAQPMQVSETKYNWSQVAQSIAGDKTTDYDRAYAIYRWLCDNIEYDTTYTIHDADTAFETRRGVCQAYCELFYRIGEPLGLKVDIIGGKSKDPDGKVSEDPGHAWVFVYTNGNSGILIDPTWGAGGIKNGRFERTPDDDSWFHVDPAWMIFSHYPDSEAYQLMADKIDYATFKKLPSYRPALAEFGFKGKDLLAQALAGNAPDLPECYKNSKIKVLRVPQTGTLRVGEEYEFVTKPSADYEFVIINGKEYAKDWYLSNGQHYKKFVPSEGGELTVGYRQRGSGNGEWSTLVEYKVAKPSSADIANLERLAPGKSPLLRSLPNYDADRYAKRGLDAAAVLAAVKRDGIKKLPKIYSDGEYKLNDVPLNGELKVGQTYRFAFSPYAAGDWEIVNEETWLKDWEQDPVSRAWYMTVTPTTPGSLGLYFKPQNSTTNKYACYVKYDVVR